MITSNGNGTGVTATMDRLDIYDGLMALRKACQAQELELPSHLIDVAAECILEILQQEIITTPHKLRMRTTEPSSRLMNSGIHKMWFFRLFVKPFR